MKPFIFIIFEFHILVLSSHLDHLDVSFTKINCNDVNDTKTESFDYCLKVEFSSKKVPANKTDDVLLLRNVKGEKTVLEGLLLKEKSRATVTIKDEASPEKLHVCSLCLKKCNLAYSCKQKVLIIFDE